MRILIANRGEIVRRIARTARGLGHETVVVYADPDRDAAFVKESAISVRIGPAALDASYLDIEALLGAAHRSGATAIHPGYGFLAENAAFANAVGRAGLVWIGPHAEAIERMGSKIEARGLADEVGIRTIPGFDASQDPGDLAAAAKQIGYPVLIKAAAGGGGKGIRIVRAPGDFEAALDEARVEAERNFADAAVIVERYIERARHVEVQIVGDRHGHVIDLGTRECSVQRRYQKLLEEAPAPNLPESTIEGLRRSARELAGAIQYDSTGTVEFVVDDETGDYFFLEMNTRLQVEHPVTEAITGVDLVELQLCCAEGRPLPLTQAEVRFRGHAFEARINAEDAAAGFAPQIGRVAALRVPADVRWESGIEEGSEITPFYDPMVAKLVAAGPDRDVARRRLAAALDELILAGVVTNTGFQRWLIETDAVVAGRVTTRFLDENEYEAPDVLAEAAELAGSAWTALRRAVRSAGPWSAAGSFRVTPHRPGLPVVLVDRHGDAHELRPRAGLIESAGSHLVIDRKGETRRIPVAVDLAARRVAINLMGETHTFRFPPRSDYWAPSADADGPPDTESIRAPFPAVVTEIVVAVGDSLAAGDVVVVIEAMKMLHSLSARGAAVVDRVHVAVGESVDMNQVLVSFDAGPAGQGEGEEG
ncbi:MAG: 3-methylcrotonyl-CoA carboxylase [Deltaproteobacteria bacterium]|nr:3-methylcrotonyl-CoA carboxylase [Deltaproteobacteria bacterium]